MALNDEAYQALEDIVGPDNISRDPAITDAYAYQMGSELAGKPDRFMLRPSAVIMPATTEEVQAMVKACNRYHVKYKAYSTGWGYYAAVQDKDAMQVDMRRMNRILEIDEKNLFAVIEPYVVSAQLQAEAMKLGLNTHIIGAGAGCSPLAAACSGLQGNGPDTISMGMASENLLGLEWVMPNGDILRTGSLGAGCGWFCGEGPGPSVRGICRGYIGGCGGLGIYTKCAIRLHPWPGPTTMPVEGTTPAYKTPLPKNIRCYTLAFPTWQGYADCYHKLYEAEIGYIVHRQFNMFGEELEAAMVKIISDPTRQLDDLEELLKTPEIQQMTEDMKRSFQIVLAGMSPRDIEYQEKAIDEILAETGGNRVAAMSDPEIEKYALMYLLKLCYKNLNYVYAGGYMTCFTHKGPPDFVISYVHDAEELLARHQATGLISDGGANSMMGGAAFLGGGGTCWFEQFMFYDPHVKESRTQACTLCTDSAKFSIGRKWPGTYEGFVGSAEEKRSTLLASNQPDLYRWQGKIKKAVDPNEVGDGSYPALQE